MNFLYKLLANKKKKDALGEIKTALTQFDVSKDPIRREIWQARWEADKVNYIDINSLKPCWSFTNRFRETKLNREHRFKVLNVLGNVESYEIAFTLIQLGTEDSIEMLISRYDLEAFMEACNGDISFNYDHGDYQAEQSRYAY